jgi:hypothetical protein
MSENKQDRNWEMLYERIRLLLTEFGTEGMPRTADYWIDDDNIGTTQQKIYIRNLILLRPHIIKSLQDLLNEFSAWEIMVAVSVPGLGDSWPDMGLTIRRDEIIDGLQRQYLPKEFLGMQYEGSKSGTDRD